MLWLQTPPWGRWIAAILVVAIALWVELRPDPLVEHPFAVAPIQAGTIVDGSNTSQRRVPRDLFEPVDLGQIAVRSLASGSPVLPADLDGARSAVPSGWWVVSTEVPHTAMPGDTVRVVLLDTGMTVEGVVASASDDDPLGSGLGGVAIAPDTAAEVAAAAANGRLAVLVSTG